MKKVFALILAAVLAFIMAAPAFAAGEYEISDRVLTKEEIGTEFYPYVKTADELTELFTSDLGTEIVSAIEAKFDKDSEWFCIVGEGIHRQAEHYFLIYNMPSTGGLACTPYPKNMVWGMLSTSKYCVCRPVTVPSTGDNTPVALMAGLLALSGIGLVALKKRTAR